MNRSRLLSLSLATLAIAAAGTIATSSLSEAQAPAMPPTQWPTVSYRLHEAYSDGSIAVMRVDQISHFTPWASLTRDARGTVTGVRYGSQIVMLNGWVWYADVEAHKLRVDLYALGWGSRPGAADLRRWIAPGDPATRPALP